MPSLLALEWAALIGGLGLALLFKPWQVLRVRALQGVWLGALVLLPWMWWSRKLLPSGMPLHLSGACLLVLMFGWPMAVWMLLLVAVGAAVLDLYGPQQLSRVHGALASPLDWHQAGSLLWTRADDIVSHWVWMGLLPASIGLALGLLSRRLLPHHLFVYILGRGFIGTALAVTLTGALGLWAGHMPIGFDSTEWMIGHWLLGWGEAISTGMLVAIFVAFKPEWMLTYSDARYLPGVSGGPRP